MLHFCQCAASNVGIVAIMEPFHCHIVLCQMAPACSALTNDYKTEIQTDIALQPLIKSQKRLAVTPEHQAVLVLVTKILLFHDAFNPGIELLVHLRLGDITFGAKFHCLN